MVKKRKTKSPVDRWFWIIVSISVVLASLACVQDTVSVSLLTETREALQAIVEQSTMLAPTEPPAISEESAEMAPGPLAEGGEEEDWEIEFTPVAEVIPTESISATDGLRYMSQNGDTLRSVAVRFGVQENEISGAGGLSMNYYLPINTPLTIPARLGDTSLSDVLFPDSELIFSPSAADFDVSGYVNSTSGFLVNYEESTSAGYLNGSEIVSLVAVKYSINPRLLLTLLEYQSGWLTNSNPSANNRQYPMGYIEKNTTGLEKQLNWACQQLTTGFYGWRSGRLLYLSFPNGGSLRISPFLNAGTVGLEFFFARTRNVEAWFEALYGGNSMLELHSVLFGDYWSRSKSIEPYLSGQVSVPSMEFPFELEQPWNYTGGPHEVWGDGSPYAALDFAPMGVAGCSDSNEWITAMISGMIVRSEEATVVLDADMDGNEQTGWVIFYFHVNTRGRIPAGVVVEQGDRIGHPSCLGGNSTGTHTHIARKYNGEWIPAGEPGAPMVMSGWMAQNGPASYQGLLVKNEAIIKSSRVSSLESSVMRSSN
jgi:LysM repeat protein